MSQIPAKEGMHKSQLQELCQRRSWPLPEYTIVKEGPPHRPYFKATAVVNGLAFHSSNFLKRAKDAQIEAARNALSHFTSTPPAGGTDFLAPENKIVVSTVQDCAATGKASSISINVNKQPVADEVMTRVQHEQFHPPENAPGAKRNKHTGEPHMYKNQLQSVVMKKGYGLPIYTFEREGPPHNSRFKSKVTVNGQTYESTDLFSTLKESEQAAAKVALFSLVTPETQDVSLDYSIFKNLLQAYAQKSGFQLPTYDTSGSGVHHMPTFVSAVLVGGETFYGQEAKTKKLAEMNAAKVAYTCLSQRGNLGCTGSDPIYVPKGVSGSSLKATDTADLRETNKLGASSKLIVSQGVSGLPIDSLGETPSPSPTMHTSPREAMECIPSSQIEGSSPQVPCEVLHGSVLDSNVDMLSGPSSSLCNVVHVYPRILNLDCPVGAVVKHSDDKWVAFRFPGKQTGN